MSQLAQVAEIAGVTTADVVRVATRGGTTVADWDIAHAIEQATGRPAAETMWAGPAREARHTPAVAPINPEAKHDPRVRIYPENTSPEDPGRIAPHHPGDDTPEHDEADEDTQVAELAAAVYSDLDDLLRPIGRSTGRLVRSWATTAQARRELAAVLGATRPRTRNRLALAA